MFGLNIIDFKAFTTNTTFYNPSNNNVLLLFQWQYWWWFWFALVWVFYFFFISKIFKIAGQQVHTKIYTSTRTHGKWGDFLITAIPLIWCLNILVNANLFFRLVDWQTEPARITVRIQAQQWFWTYRINEVPNSAPSYFFGRTTTHINKNKMLNAHAIKITQHTNTAASNVEAKNIFTYLKSNNSILRENTNFINYKYIIFNTTQNIAIQKQVLLESNITNLQPEILENIQEKTIIQQKYNKNTTLIKGYSVNNDTYLLQQLLQTNKQRFPKYNERLLRVTAALHLPTSTNISVITNSFDVIHSWFVPGLGLKLDCVPGKSTHHTLNIQTPGYYFGQCAEICGRYHHHMPIKLIALEYTHFILWWNSNFKATV